MNTTSAAAINATEASKKLVAVCENSGRPFYIGATVNDLTKEHQDISGTRQEFVECAREPKREKTDFTIYEVPTSVAEEIDGDSRIDFNSEFGKGVRYRVIAVIKDDEQNLSALKEAIAKPARRSGLRRSRQGRRPRRPLYWPFGKPHHRC